MANAVNIDAMASVIAVHVESLGALEQALTQVKQLEGLLPICAWCHKIRDDGNGTHWQSVERYVSARSDARFTHTICPDCRATVMAAPAGAAR